MSPPLLPFVQFDFAGRLGPDDGRYLVRSADGKTEHVLVVGGIGGLALAMRRRRRRRRPRKADRDGLPEVPVSRLTVIRPGGFETAAEAAAWISETAADDEAAEAESDAALAIVNRALHAHRLATLDPGGGVSAIYALATRLGYGTGDELADGHWTEAVTLPPAAAPRRRADALRPQERIAADLGRRVLPDACETLLLRARADVDGERWREAALQLRVGLEALLREVGPAGAGPASGPAGDLAAGQAERQAADLADLEERRGPTGSVANEALAGELSAERAQQVADTVAICERVLRRRRVMAR